MTHDELLAKINKPQIHTIHYTGLASEIEILTLMASRNALRAVVEFHRPIEIKDMMIYCQGCSNSALFAWDSCPTIQAIEKELG
jgi:hypothetical protein